MYDERNTKLADLLVNYSVGVKKGDKVLIYGDAVAEPLLNETYVKVLEAGGHPLMMPIFRETRRLLLTNASQEQLADFPDVLINVAKTYDAVIFIYGETNTQLLNKVPSEKMVEYFKARSQVLPTRSMKERQEGKLIGP